MYKYVYNSVNSGIGIYIDFLPEVMENRTHRRDVKVFSEQGVKNFYKKLELLSTFMYIYVKAYDIMSHIELVNEE